MCRQGASVIQASVLDAIDDASLRAYVVWLPMLPDDREATAREACALVPDRRGAHFWDADGELPPTFASVLGLPEGWPAWDVYLAYPAGATWQDEAPAPGHWQHQLGDDVNAPRLDGETFARQVRRLMEWQQPA